MLSGTDINIHPQAPELTDPPPPQDPCYTEEDIQYKVENAGLDNVDISEQASVEECRTHCRHLQIGDGLELVRLFKYFLFVGPSMKQSTSHIVQATPNADASRIWTWTSPDKRKLTEPLAMWNASMIAASVAAVLVAAALAALTQAV